MQRRQQQRPRLRCRSLYIWTSKKKKMVRTRQPKTHIFWYIGILHACRFRDIMCLARSRLLWVYLSVCTAMAIRLWTALNDFCSTIVWCGRRGCVPRWGVELWCFIVVSCVFFDHFNRILSCALQSPYAICRMASKCDFYRNAMAVYISLLSC